MKKINIILSLIILSSTTNLRFLEEFKNPIEIKGKTNSWQHIELLSKAAQNITTSWKDILEEF